MKKICLIVCVSLALAGCSRSKWVKPGASPQDFVRDEYACEKDARQSGYFGEGLVGTLNMQEFQNKCMRANGYRLQKVKK